MKDSFQRKDGFAKETATKDYYKTVKCYFEGKEVSYSFEPAEYNRVFAEYSKRGGPVSFTSYSPAASDMKLLFIEKNGYWKIRR
jgi:hypothetical protein